MEAGINRAYLLLEQCQCRKRGHALQSTQAAPPTAIMHISVNAIDWIVVERINVDKIIFWTKQAGYFAEKTR